MLSEFGIYCYSKLLVRTEKMFDLLLIKERILSFEYLKKLKVLKSNVCS